MATNRIGVGVLAAGLSAAQAALTLAQAERPAKLGQGSHTYEWVSGWLKLPPGMNVGQTHGDVVVDSEDRVYFSVDSGNAIFQTDTEGHVARVFGQALGGGVHGMRLVKEPGGREVIWIAHLSRHEVLKISLDGQILMTIPFPDKGGMYRDANEYVPTAVDVSPNGDVYVADGYGRYWVHRFNAKGEYAGVSMYAANYAVCTENGPQTVRTEALFEGRATD